MQSESELLLSSALDDSYSITTETWKEFGRHDRENNIARGKFLSEVKARKGHGWYLSWIDNGNRLWSIGDRVNGFWESRSTCNNYRNLHWLATHHSDILKKHEYDHDADLYRLAQYMRKNDTDDGFLLRKQDDYTLRVNQELSNLPDELKAFAPAAIGAFVDTAIDIANTGNVNIDGAEVIPVVETFTQAFGQELVDTLKRKIEHQRNGSPWSTPRTTIVKRKHLLTQMENILEELVNTFLKDGLDSDQEIKIEVSEKKYRKDIKIPKT